MNVLLDNNSGKFLKRWPGRNGSPALWVDDVADAINLTPTDITNFDELVGYWEYAKTDCSVVEV